ncbi:MAG: phenylalanine--tRNA ligase subunit beta [Candidatus Saccharibacteria bacterium]|nr:phenylalanine--tRNA ligase subunit beta [Candidatus Saccharibacteria bacterium]
MLISLNWLKKYVDIDVSDDELVRLIGSRLVEVEGVIDETHKYDKIYAVKVVSAEKIPDTHLSLCAIDDGGRETDIIRDKDGNIQVMCGAPNVHAGMMAAWIAPGAIVPASVHDDAPFVIGMRKMLKKYDSYGMLAGADELDFGGDHLGIAELDPKVAKPGMPLADIYELNDIILDIENKSLTHRPDTFGVIGFAREVAGILGKEFKTPEWLFETKPSFKNEDVELDIEIADKKLCPRYTALVMMPHGEFEDKYLTLERTYLCKSGMRPVSPIVDLTNYLMLLSGQPTHAFDYDKFLSVGKAKTPKILVRAAKDGEKLTLLDDREVELNSNDIVITSNDIPVALAGAMGGKNTEIDENTKRIILESATFSLFNLRKTQMNHGIFSEAITRFTKGQPAGQTLPVALKFAEEAKALKPVALFDSQKKAPEPIVVTISLEKMVGLLGKKFTAEETKTILENVNFDVTIDGDKISCTVPYWRTDIHIAEDIYEEIGRLSGFDNIDPILPLHETSESSPRFVLKSRIREFLSARGANESLTYSFVNGELLNKVKQDEKNSYKIVNSISPDLQYIRQSIAPSLLNKAYMNIRAGYKQFAMFEFNQVYRKSFGLDEQKVPNGRHELSILFINGDSKCEYYQAKHYLEALLQNLNIDFEIRKFESEADKSNAYYEPKRSAAVYVGDKLIGYLGEVKNSILQGFKLPQGTACFELALDCLAELQSDTPAKRPRFSQYPSVERDITLTVAGKQDYQAVEKALKDVLEAKDLIYSVKPVSIYQAEGQDTKNLSFRVSFADANKTLAKEAIQAIMKELETVKF